MLKHFADLRSRSIELAVALLLCVIVLHAADASADAITASVAAAARPADDRSVNVFDAAIRGRTDRSVYRFRKPIGNRAAPNSGESP